MIDAEGEGGNQNTFDYREHTAAAILDRQGGIGSTKHYAMHQLLLVVKGAFARPIAVYAQQMQAKDTSLRIKKVAIQQSLKKAADATAEALEKEAAVDPKLVKVLIAKSVQKEVKKQTAKLDKKKVESKKVSGGAQKPTGASLKKKSPKQRGRAPSRVASASSGADDDAKDGGGGKRSSRKQSSKSRSRRKSGSGATKRNKSKGAPKRK